MIAKKTNESITKGTEYELVEILNINSNIQDCEVRIIANNGNERRLRGANFSNIGYPNR